MLFLSIPYAVEQVVGKDVECGFSDDYQLITLNSADHAKAEKASDMLLALFERELVRKGTVDANGYRFITFEFTDDEW